MKRADGVNRGKWSLGPFSWPHGRRIFVQLGVSPKQNFVFAVRPAVKAVPDNCSPYRP